MTDTQESSSNFTDLKNVSSINNDSFLQLFLHKCLKIEIYNSYIKLSIVTRKSVLTSGEKATHAVPFPS